MTISTTRNKIDNQHQNIWSLLPWYINDSLDDEHYQQVEHHLKHCNSCQKELQMQQEVHKTINKIKSGHISTAKKAFAFNTVMQQISTHNFSTSNKRFPSHTVTTLPRVLHAIKSIEIGSIPYSIAASFVIAISVSIILLQSNNQKIYRSLNDNQQASNLTQTVKTASNQGQYLTHIIFNKNTSNNTIQSMLSNYQGKLSDGPDSHGFYTIDFFSAVNSSQQYHSLLSALKLLPEILLINTINQSLRGKQ